MVINILALGLGYLFGNFQTAYIIGKALGVEDIRNHGSGNSGATNVTRVLGWKAGALTFLGDFSKALLAVLIAQYLLKTNTYPFVVLYAGIGAILGHNWPVVLGFKGGKGIASTIGALIGIHPVVGLIFVAMLIVIIYITRYVSVGSILSAAVLPFLFAFFGPPHREYLIFAAILCILAIYKHKQNIVRLFKGEEKKIGQKTSEKY